MDLTPINDTCFYFAAPVNMGYVRQGDKGMLIDAGIDDSVMRKALKQLKDQDLPISHMLMPIIMAGHIFCRKDMISIRLRPCLK